MKRILFVTIWGCVTIWAGFVMNPTTISTGLFYFIIGGTFVSTVIIFLYHFPFFIKDYILPPITHLLLWTIRKINYGKHRVLSEHLFQVAETFNTKPGTNNYDGQFSDGWSWLDEKHSWNKDKKK